MRVIIQKTADSAALFTARIIARELRKTRTLVLGLATGGTMEPVYDQLAAMHAGEGLDFSSCSTFNLDEYVGLAPEDEHSYRHYMNARLFNRVNISLERTRLPNAMATDLDAECAAYEKAIEAAGGIGLQLLGIGRNGHIGFNEPTSSLSSRTRAIALSRATVSQNERYFDSPESMPKLALSMGIGTILESKSCLLLATGEEKAEVIAKAVEGPVSSMVPASALQFHPSCTVVLDEAAASKLIGTEDYRWAFEQGQEWSEFR